MRELSFFSNAFKHFPLEYALDSLKDLNYAAVELWCKGQHVTPYDGEEQVILVKNLVSSRGMKISALSAHFDYITSKELREENIQKFKHVIDLASKFSLGIVLTSSGYLHGQPPSKTMEERFLGAMRRLGDYAEEKKITIALEPEPEKFLRRPGQTVRFIEHVGIPVFKIVCDLSHAIALNMAPEEFIGEMHDYLGHVHVDDAKYGQHPHKHLIPGDGDVDYGKVFDYLDDIAYEGWLSVELNQHTTEPKLAAAKAMNYLRGML
ncbi:MAG: sugar phosphate isomerase/epimerase family protein [Candidatus Hydrothermarchaeota archaeon]|jgi:sugar phosphate isomerase/epimerase|nr:sugar phosphate isomerase/epimerase family protein [Candidatus Hydrothermarchaeota archaeon]